MSDSFNPFRHHKVIEPRDIDQSVGLNNAPVIALMKQMNLLIKVEPGRHSHLDRLQFVTSRQAGMGKSHLIGRLFRLLRGKATLVYVRPFRDPLNPWRSILYKIVHELDFPDCVDDAGLPGASQLEAFAHGVLRHLAANAVKSGRIKVKDRARAVRVLRRSNVEEFRRNKNRIKWMISQLAAMGSELRATIPNLNTSADSWLPLCIHLAYFPNRSSDRIAATDWLKGSPITLMQAESLGLSTREIPGENLKATEINDLCSERIGDLCKLAAFFRPFFFCFDETEGYRLHPDLPAVFGVVASTLFMEMPNQMTVITANIEPWARNIAPYWEQAQLDLLSKPIELEALDRRRAGDLIEMRLKPFSNRIPPDRQSKMMDETWLNTAIFKDTPGIGIRDFLKECHDRWQAVRNEPVAREKLSDLYPQYVETVRKDPRRLVYDVDALGWVLEDLAGIVNGIESLKTQGHGYVTLQWNTDRQKVFFGFEGGAHHRRWLAIAKEAHMLYRSHKAKSVFLRTQKMPEIPKINWKSADVINKVKNICLQILVVDPDWLGKLYAARDLYGAALEGDIPFTPEAVAGFLAEELAEFWKIILNTPPTAQPVDSRKETAMEASSRIKMN